MRVLPFQIPKTADESFRVQIDRESYFYDILHQHPEIQITTIVSGTGTLVQGDYLGRYSPGDVFLIGSNVPHVLKSDKAYYDHQPGLESHAISIFFDTNSLGPEFFNLSELKKVSALLQNSGKGFRLHGTTKRDIAELLRSIRHKDGLPRVLAFLSILDLLSDGNELEDLATANPQYILDEHQGNRLKAVMQFTLDQYQRNIRLEEVAGLVHMTPASFCRFFKLRTRKTYINFLNELRIFHACELLEQSDRTVLEVCFESGFMNLSNFNRKFKQIKGCSPSTFRQTLSNRIEKEATR